jgi:hypothetical protein
MRSITWRTGRQIASEKRRNPSTTRGVAGCSVASLRPVVSPEAAEDRSGPLFRDAVETPAVWDALQLVLPPILEHEAGAGNQVLHCL